MLKQVQHDEREVRLRPFVVFDGYSKNPMIDQWLIFLLALLLAGCRASGSEVIPGDDSSLGTLPSCLASAHWAPARRQGVEMFSYPHLDAPPPGTNGVFVVTDKPITKALDWDDYAFPSYVVPKLRYLFPYPTDKLRRAYEKAGSLPPPANNNAIQFGFDKALSTDDEVGMSHGYLRGTATGWISKERGLCRSNRLSRFFIIRDFKPAVPLNFQ